jgi:hypothetical protein
MYFINDKLKIAPSLNLIFVIHPMEAIKWHIVEFGGNWLIYFNYYF